MAQAAKSSGGIVIAQVERIVANGSLPPMSIKVPGISVDYVVVASGEDHMQTYSKPTILRTAVKSAYRSQG